MNVEIIAIATSTAVTLTTIITKYQSDKMQKQFDIVIKSIDNQMSFLNTRIKELTEESKKYIEVCGSFLSKVDKRQLNDSELSEFEVAAYKMQLIAADYRVNSCIDDLVSNMRQQQKLGDVSKMNIEDNLYSDFYDSLTCINDIIASLSKEQSLLLEQQKNIYLPSLDDIVKEWIRKQLRSLKDNK